MEQNYLSNLIVPKQKDVFGQAALDFFKTKQVKDIHVYAENFDPDYIPVDYLFRTFDEMPILERKALANASGNVLDVGAGVGSHSLYLQNKLHLNVKAIDQSPGSIEVAKMRGVKQVELANFFNLSTAKKFDTLLMLMNGIGIVGTLAFLPNFFEQVKKLLLPHGKLILDSSDLVYLFDKEELNEKPNYYGEMRYQIGYETIFSDEFDWLYISFEELKKQARLNGFSCHLLASGAHYDYLAELKPI